MRKKDYGKIFGTSFALLATQLNSNYVDIYQSLSKFFLGVLSKIVQLFCRTFY